MLDRHVKRYGTIQFARLQNTGSVEAISINKHGEIKCTDDDKYATSTDALEKLGFQDFEDF